MPLQSKIIPRSELLKQRSAVPATAEKIADPLDRVFVKILAGATIDFHIRLKRWWLQYADSRPEGEVPREINPGSKLPALPIFLRFVQYQALSTRGRISEYAVKGTIKTQMHSLMSLWRREALQALPPHYYQQILAYIDSEELHNIAPLSTESRPKYTLTGVDFEILVRAFFQDPGFRTTRMAVQMAYLISIQSLMTERPGALVEGSKYRNTDRALRWTEHQWHVVPNPDDPRHPHVYIRALIHRLKGLGSDQSAYKEFILYPEPNSNRAYCPFSMATAMALEDGIFADVTTAEEIFHPAIPPTDHHILSQRPSVSTLCTVRGEILNDNVWETSPSRAMTYDVYNGHLRRTSLNKGFVSAVTGYCARRGASNRLSGQISDEKLRTLMGHTKKSDMFDTSYKSKLIDIDLGAVLHDRPINESNVRIGGTASNMSARMDANAPQRLSIEETAELLAEEELVAMRETREKLAKQVATLSKDIKSAEDDEASQISTTSQIAALKAQLEEHDKEYKNIVAREKRVRVKKAREEYFAGASARQLKGIDPVDKKGKTSAKGKENRPPSSVPILSKSTSSMDEFIATFFDAATAFDTDNDSIIAYIKAINSLPHQRLNICYPNESPDHANKCPVCGTLCSSSTMPKGIGKHIHNCIMARTHADAQQRATDNFDRTTCAWDGCSTKVYESRPDFIAHIHTHLTSLTKLSLRGNQMCKWREEGEICAEEGDGGWIVPDWANHFATEHYLNVNATITIDHCTICGQWFEDDMGDGASWAGHCMGHYDDMFSPFQERQDGLIDLQPTGIVDIGGAISYDPRDSVSGPLLHGHIKRGIALRPYFCPFCVFNADLPIARRMMQYRDVSTFQRHLSQQHLLDSDTTLCPVPSCGMHKFSPYELATHLVLFHRLPVVGTLRSVETNTLRLPTLDKDGGLDLMLVHNGGSAVPSKRSTSDDDDQAGPSKKPQIDTNHERPGITPSIKKYHCTGCRQPVKDITKHFITSALASLCRKRHAFFQLSDDGRKIGPFTFELPTDTSLAGTSTKRGRHHYCPSCDELFVDIRTHLPDHCSSKKFKIKEPKKHRRGRDGVEYVFAEWVLTAPPLL